METEPPIRATVFDAYGTLFDVHSVIRRAEELFPGKGQALSHLWRQKQLEYTWLRTLMGRYEDFEAVTRGALEFACRSLGIPFSEETTGALMGEYDRLSCYPEVPDALDRLKDCKRGILSNGSPRMLNAAVAHAGLADRFDEVLSVDALKLYKPDPRAYELAPQAFGVDKREIAFVSSNFWDIAGATSFGFRTFWLNRAGAHPEPLGVMPSAVLRTLDDLVEPLTA